MNQTVQVVPAPDGQIMLVFIDNDTYEQLAIPMDRAAAENVGKALLAPSVARPPGAGLVMPNG